jgi:hypothetical protein
MPQFEIEAMSAAGAARMLDRFGYFEPGTTDEQIDAKLVEIMGQELVWVGRSWSSNFALLYAGGGVWVRLTEVPVRENRAHLPLRAWYGTPNDGAGTEDFAPNH